MTLWWQWQRGELNPANKSIFDSRYVIGLVYIAAQALSLT